MHATPAACQAHPFNTGTIDCADDLLPRHPIFRTRDLEHAREHIVSVFGDHRVAYLPRERLLDFRHREAKLGAIAVNSMQYGGGVMVKAALGDLYLLQFTLTGTCELRQGRNYIHTPAGSVAIINPFLPFTKTRLPETRQLIIRIDRRLPVIFGDATLRQTLAAARVDTARAIAVICAVRMLLLVAVLTGSAIWLYTIYNPERDRLYAAVAFSLFPVSVADLMAVSDAGEIMPPKSTWFEPKLRDGLLIHLI